MTHPSPPPKLLSETESQPRFLVFILALISSALLWLSFPPIGFWWLAWVAPVPMLWLINCEKLPARKPYWLLWFVGFIYWLATFYFIPIPHKALFLGWIAVCLYMSIYTPLFVAVARLLNHHYRVPSVIAAPIAWTGLEWIRCNVATGMAMACLSHTQYQQPTLIQIADLSGAYTLTFAMVMVAAGISFATIPNFLRIEPPLRFQSRIAGGFVSVLALATVIGYGFFRLNETGQHGPGPGQHEINVAIIQSSVDVIFEPPTLEEETARFEQYRDLTAAAREKWPDLDLILWPESAFPTSDLLSDYDEVRTVERFADAITDIWGTVTEFPYPYSKSVPLLTGATTQDPEKKTIYNSALLIREPGVVTDRYYKNHRVMIGEYTPFGDWFPWLYEVTPIGRGLTAGTKFESFDVNGVRIAPNICFESTIPHLIRRQVNALAAEYEEPDVLVNLTNDGWFFGTSCLDLHLACNVFRAIEMRKTNLVCANTGFSAEIDAWGRLKQVGPRRDTGILKATVTSNDRTSSYRVIGDILPGLLGVICIGVLLRQRFRG